MMNRNSLGRMCMRGPNKTDVKELVLATQHESVDQRPETAKLTRMKVKAF